MIKFILLLKAAGVPVGIFTLIGMGLRKTLTTDVAHALIINHKSELGWPVAEIEAHALAGGHVKDTLMAAAGLNAISVDYDRRTLTAVDLAKGRTPQLVIAFATAHKSQPALRFDEFCDRFLAGEDVIAATERGDFQPRNKVDTVSNEK
ncbi:MAG TPA: flotillin-like FloA family protein [Gemmatimonadota bacterium]|nr:flotillin-like FloA family protein [Gemmatimonadota bacterium]